MRLAFSALLVQMLFSLAACSSGEIADLDDALREDALQGETFDFRGGRYRRISANASLDLGVVHLDPETRRSATITFDVPRDAVSFAVHILDADSARNPSFIHELTDPNGRAIISPAPAGVSPDRIAKAGRGQSASANAMLPEVFNAISTTTVPNGPGVDVVSGTWKVAIAEEVLFPEQAARDKRVSVVVKRCSERAPSFGSAFIGVLSARLHIAPGSSVDGLARSAPTVMRELPQLERFFGDRGIALRVRGVDTLDRSANAAAYGLRTSEPNATFVDLMRRPKDGAVEIHALAPNIRLGYQGIASLGGASATLMADKRHFGGVIIQQDRHNFEATLAHELGHHLGLYHTNVDHLSDTASEDHFIDGFEGAAPNLMNDGAPAFDLTEQQRRVILWNPAVAWYRRD